jgi:hypothetical protein
MKLLKSVNYFAESYQKKLVRMNERTNLWMTEISKEKRIGLSEDNPYDNNPLGNNRLSPQKDDSIDFQPQDNIEPPTQSDAHNRRGPTVRIHLVYNPGEGKIEKVIKTPIRSRPPAEYMEATADQVRGALKHLNNINPELAQKLVRGDMSVWIPRAHASSMPSNVKHLGLSSDGNHNGSGTNKVEMSPERLANAHKAASQMSFA